jgi:hypothetical protein
VDEGGQVTTVVEDKVELLVILEGEQLLLKAPLVLLLGLTLPGEAVNETSQKKDISDTRTGDFGLHRDTGSGNGGSGVVLGGEDVAGGPGDLSTESNEGLDEDSGLDGC